LAAFRGGLREHGVVSGPETALVEIQTPASRPFSLQAD
jgi:hypothetical protein